MPADQNPKNEGEDHRSTADGSLEGFLTVGEDFLNSLMASSPDAIYVKDRESRVIRANNTLTSWWGLTDPAKAVGLTDFDIFGEKLGREYYEEEQNIISSGQPIVNRVGRHPWPDGSASWMSTTKIPLRNAANEIIGIVGITRDISERKAQEAEIHRLNRIYAVLSQVNQAVVRTRSREQLFQQICDIAIQFGDFKLAWVGQIEQGTNRILSVASSGEACGYLEKIAVYADDRPEGHGPTGTCYRTDISQLANDFANDPSTVPWRNAATQHGIGSAMALPIHNGGVLCAVFTVYAGEKGFFQTKEINLMEEVVGDISFALDNLDQDAQRRQAEAALKESEEMFRSLFSTSREATLLVGYDGVIDCNAAAMELFGWTSKEQALSKHPCDYSPPTQPDGRDSHTAAQEHLKAAFSTGSRFFEWTHLRSDGISFPAEILLSRFELKGHPALQVVIRDVSWRKTAEKQLRQLSRAVEQSPSSVVITDTKGIIEYVNPKFAVVSGFSPDEVIGRNSNILKSGNTPPEVYRELWETITAGCEWHGEFQNKKKNGDLYWEAVSICPITDESGAISHYLAVKEDVTERKMMNERFLRSQRMESIGSLAGGVAHDLNNILAPIMMATSMMHKRLPPDTLEHYVSTIEEAAQRGADIIKQVLTFARGVEGRRVVFDLKLLFEQVGRMVWETFPKSIAFSVSLPDDLWMLTGDLTQLHQVLLNLCVNARDAMPQGGTLMLSAENCEIRESAAFVAPEAKPGCYVKMTVVDSGVGISQKIIAKIFDPFFTTKEPGKGTGLGLSTVIGIVRSHGGFIQVDSLEGKGSTFNVFIPATMSELVRPEAEPETVVPTGNSELILVVDDEPQILKVVEPLLTSNGYKVITAGDGIEALKAYQQHRRSIDLVLTDLMMPRMDGMALARALGRIDPELVIVATTGHGQESLHEELEMLGISHHLQKPFNAGELLAVIYEAIHKRNRKPGV